MNHITYQLSLIRSDELTRAGAVQRFAKRARTAKGTERSSAHHQQLKLPLFRTQRSLSRG